MALDGAPDSARSQAQQSPEVSAELLLRQAVDEIHKRNDIELHEIKAFKITQPQILTESYEALMRQYKAGGQSLEADTLQKLGQDLGLEEVDVADHGDTATVEEVLLG